MVDYVSTSSHKAPTVGRETFLRSTGCARPKFNGHLRAPKRSIGGDTRSSRKPRHQRTVKTLNNVPRLPPTSLDNDSTSSWSSHALITSIDFKRPRPESPARLNLVEEGLSSSAPAAYFHADDSISGINMVQHEFPQVMKRIKTRFGCDVQLINKDRLHDMMSRELCYHPNNEFLYYVNPVIEEKVDASMRNDAIHNLRFVHNVYFSLTTHTFCKAINIIDRFIAKVKVKPKYIACVATASYRAASSLTNDANGPLALPEPKSLVQITRCGGNEFDLKRMEQILVNKLGPSLDNINAYDFLMLFCSSLVGLFPGDSHQADETATVADEEYYGDSPESPVLTDAPSTNQSEWDYKPLTPTEKAKNRLLKKMRTRMEMSLCSLEVYRYRPACLALAIMAYSGVEGLDALVQLANLNWEAVNSCARLVEQLCDFESREVPCFSRSRVVYNACRRRFMRLGYSSPTPLDTISEDSEPTEETKGELMNIELEE